MAKELQRTYDPDGSGGFLETEKAESSSVEVALGADGKIRYTAKVYFSAEEEIETVAEKIRRLTDDVEGAVSRPRGDAEGREVTVTSMDRWRVMYVRNLDSLRTMLAIARDRAPKKYRGYTVDELAARVADFERIVALDDEGLRAHLLAAVGQVGRESRGEKANVVSDQA